MNAMREFVRGRMAPIALAVRRAIARATGKVRGYRFDGEQENHADTARETQVSIGLMAAAAQANTDEHRIQAWQTESGLRARRAVLIAMTERTHEQAGELAAIDKGLAALHATSMDALAPGDRLWSPMERPARAPQRLLAGLAVPALVSWPAALLAVGGLLGLTTTIQTVRLHMTQNALERARTEPCARDDTRRPCGELRQARAVQADLAANIEQAADGAQQAAATIERERARNAVARRRERELLREIQERTRDVGDPPAWRLRDGEGGDPAGPGDSPSGDS